MADQGAILVDKIAIKLKDIDEPVYSLDGFLTGFRVVATGVRYVHLVENDVIKSEFDVLQNKISKGYYPKESFLEYRKTGDLAKLGKKYQFFVSAEIGDIINVKKISLFSPFKDTDFGKWDFYTLTFSGQSLVNNLGKIIQPPIPFEPESVSMGLNTIAKEFYKQNIHHNSSATTDEEKYDRALTIAKIAIYVHNINAVLFPLFSESAFTALKDSQNAYWQTDIFPNNVAFTDIKKYFNSIYNFFRAGYLNQKKIAEAKGDEKLYCLAQGLSTEALKILTAENKISLLSWMQLNVRLGQQWIFLNDNEGLVLKIIQSVTEVQADLFLNLLFSYSDVTYNNLFERLADDNGFLSENVVDDSTFGIGEDNRYGFIMSLYSIWMVSSYNPYQNEIFSDTNLAKFEYTNDEFGTNPDTTNSFFDDLFLDSNKLDFSAKPISLNYNSTSTGGYFIDNFYFRSTNIATDLNHASIDNIGTDLRDFTNLNEAPKNKVLAFQKEYTKDLKDGLYGTYDYLQSVSLIDANSDAAIKIAVVNGETTSDSDVNNLIPIFVLKYIDDKNLESNLETTVSYIIDIVSIGFGGYAAISKLKYLRTLSGFTPTLMAGAEESIAVKALLYTSVASEFLNLTAASVSLYLKIITDASDINNEGIKSLKELVMWIEVFTGVGSMLSEYKLRKSAQKVVNYYDNSTWPAEFVDDARGVEAKSALYRLANTVEDIASLVNKEYEVISQKLISRIKKSGGAFGKKHYNTEFTEGNLKIIIQDAIQLKLYNRKFAEDFVIMSCRPQKSYTYQETRIMLNYYSEVTLVKGFCTGFHNLDDYKLFCNKFKNFTENHFDFLNIKIKEYDVQGSVLFLSHPNNPGGFSSIPVVKRGDPLIIKTPDDFDGRMVISPEDGEKVAEYLKKYWKEKIPTLKKKDFDDNEWNFIQTGLNDTFIDKELKKGMLNKRVLPIEYKNGLKNAVKNSGNDIFFPNTKGYSDVGGAFIIKGSEYDILPIMAFKY